MTCKDCIHEEICDIPIITDGRKNASNCGKLKNKADFAEVVRCKDCGMSRETEDERYRFCMQFADTIDSEAFCSYGERSEA